MRSRISPMAFAAIYAFTAPLAFGVAASWMALEEENLGAVKEWQTLIAGVIAVVAALLGGGFVFYQTMESRRQHDALLSRRHAAARAVLPLALSGLLDYAEAAVESLEDLRPTIVGEIVRGPPGGGFEAPDFDIADIDMLQQTIESASEEVGDRISRIISEVQVLDSRLRGLADYFRPSSTSLFVRFNLDDYVVTVATIYARAAELFSYARRETDVAPTVFPTSRSLMSAMRLLGLDADTHPEAFAIAAQRAARHAHQD